MTLLQIDTVSFHFGGIPITDWIQAIGALVGISAGLYAFIKLFGKDKQREKEISTLVDLAKQSSFQTGELISQTAHMEESNRLLKEQTDILRERLAIDKNQKSLDEVEKELNKKQRRNDMLPRFAMTNGHGRFESLKIELTNKGEKAKILDTLILDGLDKIKIGNEINGSSIEKGEQIILTIYSLVERENANNIEYSFKLNFENTQGDKYYQKFKCTGISCKIDYPQENN